MHEAGGTVPSHQRKATGSDHFVGLASPVVNGAIGDKHHFIFKVWSWGTVHVITCPVDQTGEIVIGYARGKPPLQGANDDASST